MARAVGSTPYATRRGPRWGGVIAVLLLAAELASLVLVGRLVGPRITLLLLLVQAVLGFTVVRREARRAFRGLTGLTTTADGTTVTTPTPGWEATQAPLGVLGGLLLAIPGFLSDIAALFLLLPPTRRLASTLLRVAVLDRLVRQWTVVTVQGATTTTTTRSADGTTTTRTEGPGDPGSSGEPPTVIRGEITDRRDD